VTITQERRYAPPPPLVTPTVRLAIVDPDALLRVGLRSILEPDPWIDIIGDFESVRQLCSSAPAAQPDVLVMSAQRLDDQFNAVLSTLTRSDNRGAVAIVSIMQPDPATLRRTLRPAVRGFVDRNTSHRDLREAVMEVIDGHIYLSPTIAEVLVGWMAERVSQEPVPVGEIERQLTDRELQVLQAMGDGITNTAIARRFRIQEATVRSHIYHILSKLNLRTRTEAVLAGHYYANTIRESHALE